MGNGVAQKTYRGQGFKLTFQADYAIFETDPDVDELTPALMAESVGQLQEAYHEPFGVIYNRPNQTSIDLLAARKMITEKLPRIAASANVTRNPQTAMVVGYEKIVIDMFPIETFETIEEAVDWVTRVVRDKKSEA